MSETKDTPESLRQELSVQSKRLDWLDFQRRGGRFVESSDDFLKKKSEIDTEIARIKSKIEKVNSDGELNE